MHLCRKTDCNAPLGTRVPPQQVLPALAPPWPRLLGSRCPHQVPAGWGLGSVAVAVPLLHNAVPPSLQALLWRPLQGAAPLGARRLLAGPPAAVVWDPRDYQAVRGAGGTSRVLLGLGGSRAAVLGVPSPDGAAGAPKPCPCPVFIVLEVGSIPSARCAPTERWGAQDQAGSDVPNREIQMKIAREL